jgi:hypothetical protein
MFKLNWIIVLIIIVLLVLLYLNNREYFAGALTRENAEAVANVASMVNSGNLVANNITASNNFTANNGSLVTGDHDKLRIYTKKDLNDKGFLWFNKDGDLGYVPDGSNSSWGLNRKGELLANNITANNGSLVTGDNDKLRIYTKKDGNDKGFFWFNKHGNMGYAPDGSNSLWSINYNNTNQNNFAELCLNGTCINHDHLKVLTGQQTVEVVGHRGVLDNVNNRCGQGDSDRDIGVNCNILGHYGGWNKWKLRIK